MRGIRGRLVLAGALLVATGCWSSPAIEGEWSGREANGSYVGFSFTDDGRALEVRGDTVRELRYRLDTNFDPPRLELVGGGGEQRGVVRFVSVDELRLLVVPVPAPAPQAFSPAAPGIVLTRREIR